MSLPNNVYLCIKKIKRNKRRFCFSQNLTFILSYFIWGGLCGGKSVVGNKLRRRRWRRKYFI